MKTLPLVFCFFACMLSGCNVADQSRKSSTLAHEFVGHMFNQRFNSIMPMLSKELKNQSTLKQLKKGWAELELANGPVKSWAITGIHVAGATTFKVRCQIESAKKDGSILLRFRSEEETLVIEKIQFYNEVVGSASLKNL